jgi:hypothetical protein
MRTEAGKKDYETPDDARQLDVVTIEDPGGYLRSIPVVRYEELREMYSEEGEDVRGMPVYAALGDGRLWLYPSPDDTYEVNVRYKASETWPGQEAWAVLSDEEKDRYLRNLLADGFMETARIEQAQKEESGTKPACS